MYIPFDSRIPGDAFKSYFGLYMNRLKVGCVLCLTGGSGLKTGVGKSWAALKIMEALDPAPSIDKVCFEPRHFLEQVDLIAASGIPNQVVVLDEAAAAIPSINWWSISNRSIWYSVMTFRYCQALAILCVPDYRFIDKKIRSLITFFGSMRIDARHNNRKYLMSLYQVKSSIFGEGQYLKLPRMYNVATKKICKITRFEITAPSESLAAQYEKRSREFKDKFRRSFLQDIEKYEQAALSGGNLSNSELITIVANSEIGAQELTEEGRITKDTVINILEEQGVKIPHSKANFIAKMIRKGRERNAIPTEQPTATAGAG